MFGTNLRRSPPERPAKLQKQILKALNHFPLLFFCPMDDLIKLFITQLIFLLFAIVIRGDFDPGSIFLDLPTKHLVKPRTCIHLWQTSGHICVKKSKRNMKYICTHLPNMSQIYLCPSVSRNQKDLEIYLWTSANYVPNMSVDICTKYICGHLCQEIKNVRNIKYIFSHCRWKV